MLFAAGGVVGIVALGFWLFSLVDVITAPPAQVRNLQKVVWVVIVLVGVEVGAVFWFFFGRPTTRVAATSGPLGRPSRRVVAPDDDADFLRSLNKPHDDGGASAR